MGMKYIAAVYEERGRETDDYKRLEIQSDSTALYPDILIIDGKYFIEMGWQQKHGEFQKIYVPARLTQFIGGKQVSGTSNFSKPPQKAKETINERLWEDDTAKFLAAGDTKAGKKFFLVYGRLTQFIGDKQVGKEAIDEKLWEEKRKKDPALLPHPPKKPVLAEKKIDTKKVVKKETKMPAWKRAQLKKKGKKK